MPFTPRQALRTGVSATVCVTAILLLALTGSLSFAPAASAAGSPPVPAVPSGLPSDIEGLAQYVAANSCDPHAKPGTTALADLLVRTYGSHYGIDRTCGTDPLPTSEHYDGRAVDYFLNVHNAAQRAQMNALIGWLLARDANGNAYANARRLGVMYMIWNNRIWGSYRAADGWRPYSSCAAHPGAAYDTTCHRNHIHISLSWEGAMKRTSFWTRNVAATDYGPCREEGLNWAAPYSGPRTTPCPSYSHVSAPAGASALRRTLTTYSGMRLSRGDSGPVVSAVQQAVGTGVDGSFGPLTQAAVTSWQRAHGVAATGVVDAATWRALLSSQTVSSPAPTTSHSSLSRYRNTTLHVGSHGAAVNALQRRLEHAPGRRQLRQAHQGPGQDLPVPPRPRRHRRRRPGHLDRARRLTSSIGRMARATAAPSDRALSATSPARTTRLPDAESWSPSVIGQAPWRRRRRFSHSAVASMQHRALRQPGAPLKRQRRRTHDRPRGPSPHITRLSPPGRRPRCSRPCRSRAVPR